MSARMGTAARMTKVNRGGGLGLEGGVRVTATIPACSNSHRGLRGAGVSPVVPQAG